MSDSPTSPILLGIRHHGPGSARSLLAALERLQPDALLIEGPPEGEDLLGFVLHPDTAPPVALLAYVPDEPQRVAFYPFAEFSPEWQALRYGLGHGIPVRFIDLPQRHWLTLRKPPMSAGEASPPAGDEPGEAQPADAPRPVNAPPAGAEHRQPVDPLDRLALVAGFEDGEHWWEHLVEERSHPADATGAAGLAVFTAVLEMMRALRQDGRQPGASAGDSIDPLREAAMRQAIRTAQREGYERIAVVCGAWHAPALEPGGSLWPPAKEDAALLRGLPKVQVKMTWVAWSYEHLSRFSGYGAGAISPGWYEHLWQAADSGQTALRWLSRVAQLLREEDLDASAAQVIDAVRLAGALAAMRGRPRPGLDELNEASLAVFCFGNPLPMDLIGRRLIIGERLGQVPDSVPMVPLLQDLAASERRLRFPRQASARLYDLDLRQPTDLARSQLLHRLQLLGILWGKAEGARGQARGTFHELWTVQWQPGYTVTAIERAIWGNTVAEAAAAYTRDLAANAPDLATLTGLLDRALLAGLDGTAGYLVARIQDVSALSGDIGRLMDALPALARTLRYGSVRQHTDTGEGEKVPLASIASILEGLVARICIGLPPACASLDDDAARQMLARVEAVHSSLSTAGRPDPTALWQSTLIQLANQAGLHGLLAGRACRLLFDHKIFGADEIARRLSLALSPGGDPGAAAGWLEGLLRGSGLLLLYDDVLWGILDEWVAALSPDGFSAVAPLLRRTFAAFPAPERRQMGERVRRGPVRAQAGLDTLADVATDRADAVLPVLALLLGARDPAPGMEAER